MKVTELENGKKYLLETAPYSMDCDFLRGMQFVMHAISKDDARDVLMLMQIKGKKIYAADGFRMYMMDFSGHDLNLENGANIPEGLFSVQIVSKRFIVLERGGEKLTFPNCDKMIDDVIRLRSEELEDKDKNGFFEICFHPYYLGELGKIRKCGVHTWRCKFHRANTPALFECENDTLKFTAMIMPMHL